MSTSEELAGTVGNAVVNGLESALGKLNPFRKHHPKHKNSTSHQMEDRNVSVSLNYYQVADGVPSIWSGGRRETEGNGMELKISNERKNPRSFAHSAPLDIRPSNEVDGVKLVDGLDQAAIIFGIVGFIILFTIALFLTLRNRRRRKQNFTLQDASNSLFELFKGAAKHRGGSMEDGLMILD